MVFSYYLFLLDIPLLHVRRCPRGLQNQDAIRSLTIVYFLFRIYRLAHKGLCTIDTAAANRNEFFPNTHSVDELVQR